MKYLYSLTVIALCLLASCKSDTSPTNDAESNANSDISSESIEESGMQEVKFTEGLEVTVPAAAEVDGMKTTNPDLVESNSEAKTSKAPKIMSETIADTKEVVKPKPPKSEVKEVVTEVEREVKKEATTSPTSTPDKIIEPNLKVTVPIDQGRKPAVDNSMKEEVEKVELKKNTKSNVPNKPGAMNIDHTIFHKLLSDNVSSAGSVNYKGLKTNEGALDKYLALLNRADVASQSKSAQLAFWINAYNAFTIKKVISNYPLKSIKDLNSGKPWDDKWINLDGRTLSLNDIENKIIRPQFNEPRIHFAVNCAAQSCPPIHNAAYSAGNLNTNLEMSTKAFINNTKYNTITKDKVVISKIFEWYKEDFGDIITFLNKYSDTKIDPNATIEYMEYDWSLNGK